MRDHMRVKLTMAAQRQWPGPGSSTTRTAAASFGSTGRRNAGLRRSQRVVKCLCQRPPAHRLARPHVERRGKRRERVPAVHAQVGALREVLPQHPVGVLVRAALPWAARIAEVYPHDRVGPQCACRVISAPWSQVSGRRGRSGKVPIVRVMASRTASAPDRPGSGPRGAPAPPALVAASARRRPRGGAPPPAQRGQSRTSRSGRPSSATTCDTGRLARTAATASSLNTSGKNRCLLPLSTIDTSQTS